MRNVFEVQEELVDVDDDVVAIAEGKVMPGSGTIEMTM